MLDLLGLNNQLKLSGMIKQRNLLGMKKKLKFSGINKHLSVPEKDKQRNPCETSKGWKKAKSFRMNKQLNLSGMD